MTQASSGPALPGEPAADNSPSTSEAGFCTACGTPCVAGQSYCGRCGNPLTHGAPADEVPGRTASTTSRMSTDAGDPPAEPQLAGPAADDLAYSTEATVGAVLLSLFMPFIALIAALVLRSQEHRPQRRQFLKNWAIGSAVWLGTGWLVGIIAISSVSVRACRAVREASTRPSRPVTRATMACIGWLPTPA
jgi:hypothetical protein